MENEAMETARRLKYAMEKANLTQQDLVIKSGVDKTYISKYLNGKYMPNSKNASKLALALNVNPVWLMGIDVDMVVKDKGLVIEIENLCRTMNDDQLNQLLLYAKMLKSYKDKGQP